MFIDLTGASATRLSFADNDGTVEVTTDRTARSATNAAAVLKPLSNECRLMILCYLTADARSVTELQALLRSHQSVISHHLARLRLDGLMQAKRKGEIKLYSLRYPKLCRQIQCFADTVGAS